MLHKYFGRDVGRGVVELLDESGQDFGRLVVLRSGHQEVVAAYEFALPDEEYLNPRLAGAGRGGDYIQVLGCEMQDFLAFVDLFYRKKLVAERGGSFKFKRFGGVKHALFDGSHYLVGLAL